MDSLEWLEKSINERHINFYNYDDFINKEKTNEGGFGTIQKAEWKGYGLTVALKSLKVNKNLDKLVKELQLLRSVSLHPNINLLYGLTKGNLREYLRKKFTELIWTDKFRIGKEISQGLLFLHNNNIVHRDLSFFSELVFLLVLDALGSA
ncbi:kinase-like domain-containing protein [Gigaspora rosea]|uniref:Kinase-like domain-containing protein n=1 Tax=Gigaspora rosea TaxID=44941 RepID=A0A397VKX7_9GLOM|nr:kinase-like domain-containing protein [Gigaspora rosea]